MKFLFFTDSHIKTRTPIRRTGNYEDDILSKLVFLLITAQREKVDFIVCGGDLFDLPNPSFRLASQIMKLISSSGIQWYHVLGNHEILGHNPDSYDMGVLAFFEHLQNFKIVKEATVNDNYLKFVHYRHGIEEESAPWKTPEDPNTRSIIFAHAMVTPNPVPFTHITPNQLKKKTKANLILLGHYHDPWANVVLHSQVEDKEKKMLSEGLGKILTSSKEESVSMSMDFFNKMTLFLNPGSVARISLLAHNLRRTPRSILVNIDDDFVTITSIPIKTAKISSQIFKVEEAMLEKKWSDRIDEFLAAMENVKVEGIEASTLVINAAKIRAGVDSLEDIPDDQRKVLDYALARIERLENPEE